jgi:hypothetical protein
MTSLCRSTSLSRLGLAAGLVLCLAAAGCAKTEVESKTMAPMAAAMPRPDQVLVYNFAFAPDQVALDKGIASRVADAMDSTPPTEQELEVGEKVTAALTKRLVSDIQKMGLVAEPGTDAAPTAGKTLIVRGQILSIDEGNPTRRVVIGFGAGRSDVEAHVQVLEYTPAGDENVEQFTVIAESGRKPGMGPMAGIGAVAGHLLFSVGLSAATSAASETWGANVDADAKRLADKVSAQLKSYFVSQGWVPAGS